MIESVRKAVVDDLVPLCTMLDDAIDATPDTRGGHLFRKSVRSMPTPLRLEQAVLDSRYLVLVATIDEVVVGFALVDLGVEGATIEELFVEPEARGVGLGEGLLEAVFVSCREQGCPSIEIEVLPGDRAMKNACERAGLVARSLTMHCDLREGAATASGQVASLESDAGSADSTSVSD